MLVPAEKKGPQQRTPQARMAVCGFGDIGRCCARRAALGLGLKMLGQGFRFRVLGLAFSV